MSKLTGKAIAGITAIAVVAVFGPVGWASAARPSNPVKPPAPVAVHGAPAAGAVEIWWVPPRGWVVKDYLVQYSKNGGKTWRKATDGVTAEPRATIKGLRNGTSYVFRVASVAGAVGTYSKASSAVAPKPVDCRRPGPRANLAGCNLEGIDGVNLTGANAQGASLRGVVLRRVSGANLESTAWTSSKLADANLRGSNLSGSGLSEVDLSHANLSGASVRRAAFVWVDLAGIDATDADLSGASFALNRFGTPEEGAKLQRSIFKGASFERYGIAGNMTDADLSGASFGGGDDQYGCCGPLTLTRANLKGADFHNTWFSGAVIQDADFTDANMTNLGTRGGFTGSPKALPAGWQARDGYLVGPTVRLQGDASGKDFSGVNLAGAWLGVAGSPRLGAVNLTGVNLSGANLTGAVGEGVAMDKANLVGADLSGATLTMSTLTGANLANSKLMGATLGVDISGSDLTGADLTNAQIEMVVTGANFTDVTLTGVLINGGGSTVGPITGAPIAWPDPWTVRSGYLLGPSVRLRYANLNDLNLSGVDLTHASLQWVTLNATDMRQTLLTGIQSDHLTGMPYLPVGWALVNGTLVQNP